MLFNTDEQAVLEAKYFAMYKGVPVIKLPIGTNAFSLGYVIVLGDKVSKTQSVRHEYGHSEHASRIGFVKYMRGAAIPSFISFWLGVDYENYYSLPWEYTADALGQVNRDKGEYVYFPYAENLSNIYRVALFILP